MTFTFGSGCSVGGATPTDLIVRISGAGPVALEMSPASSSPPWNLWLFLPALGGSLVVALISMRWAKTKDGFNWGGLIKPLTTLDKSWSFSESWAANLTTAATVVTGVFASSDILQGVLGTGSAPALTVMLVAGALATAAAGAGTIITLTFRSKGQPLGIAVVAAAIVTLTGAMGQLLVIGDTSSHLALGGLNSYVWPAVIAACALLGAYGVASIHEILTAKAPPPRTRGSRRATTRARSSESGDGSGSEAWDESQDQLPYSRRSAIL